MPIDVKDLQDRLRRIPETIRSIKIDRADLSKNFRIIGIYGIVILVVAKFLIVPLKGSLEAKTKALAEYRTAVREAELRVKRVDGREKPGEAPSKELLDTVFSKEKTEYAVQADMMRFILALSERYRLTVTNIELPASVKGLATREVFVTLRFKGPTKGVVEFLQESRRIVYPPDFSADEFSGLLTVEKLCQAIEADKYPFKLKSKENSIERINELLKIPDFYDKLTATKPGLQFSAEVQALAQKTEEMRKDAVASGRLGQEDELLVRKLNRLALEEAYKTVVPKGRPPKLLDMKSLQLDRAGMDLNGVAAFVAYKLEK